MTAHGGGRLRVPGWLETPKKHEGLDGRARCERAVVERPYLHRKYPSYSGGRQTVMLKSVCICMWIPALGRLVVPSPPLPLA